MPTMKPLARLASLLAILAILTASGSAGAAQPPAFARALGQAPALPATELIRAAVMDADTGMLLLELDSGETFHPVGGVVTLMTALVALDYLDLDEAVTVGSEIKVSANVLQWGLREGYAPTVRDLIAAMLLAGAQDAAAALSACISRQAGDTVTLMNQKAAELSMTGTVYVNATGGYHADQVTTAPDALRLIDAAMEQPVLADLLSQARYRTGSADSRVPDTVVNRVTLLDAGSDGYDERVTAMLVGSTSASGFNTVMSARQGGVHVLAVMCSPAPAQDYGQDARTLLDYAFGEFDRVDLGSLIESLAGGIVLHWDSGSYTVEADAGCSLVVSAAGDLAADLWGAMDEFTLTADPQAAAAAFASGEPVTAVLAYGGQSLAGIPLSVSAIPAATPEPEPTAAAQPAVSYRDDGWVLWIVCAAAAALALILVAQMIRRKIFQGPPD